MIQDTKKKFSFNFVDALIIIFILVGISALVYTFLGYDVSELLSSKEEIKYEIVADGEFNEGDILYSKNGKREIGKIEKISTRGDKTVALVSAQAYIKDNDYFVKGQLIKTNTDLQFKHGENVVFGIVEEIK